MHSRSVQLSGTDLGLISFRSVDIGTSFMHTNEAYIRNVYWYQFLRGLAVNRPSSWDRYDGNYCILPTLRESTNPMDWLVREWSWSMRHQLKMRGWNSCSTKGGYYIHHYWGQIAIERRPEILTGPKLFAGQVFHVILYFYNEWQSVKWEMFSVWKRNNVDVICKWQEE